MLKRVIIRTDSSQQMGTGHLMRCLTLAEGLAKRSIKVDFICRDLPSNCSFLAEQKNFIVHKLKDDFTTDAKLTINICEQISQPIDWLIVDSYALDERWEKELRPYVKKIMVIDDLANRRHDCDLLLDQNFYENMEIRYDNLVPITCKKLLGPKYVLLRDEFVKQRAKLRVHNGQVNRILIFFGGSDPNNLTEVAIKAVKLLNREDIVTDVIVGIANSKKAYLEEYCDKLPNFNFHCQIGNVAEVMIEADLAIGAGGTATWERSCLGLPAIIIPVADNQIAITQNMAANGYVLAAENDEIITASVLHQLLVSLILCPGLMRFMAKRNASLIDGMGMNRVVQSMFPHNIKVRRATDADCANVFKWRNAPENRRYSFSDKLIDFDTHLKWFDSVINNDHEIMLIGEVSNNAIGVLRYRIEDDCAEISMYLVPDNYGYGYGASLLKVGNDWLHKYSPNIKHVVASVIPDNERSKITFIKAGFHLDKIFFKKELING
jgi:UDP-2,4-diacetamido-2,4,6-trideoxy-beta-L-altropyranose hydrolase